MKTQKIYCVYTIFNFLINYYYIIGNGYLHHIHHRNLDYRYGLVYWSGIQTATLKLVKVGSTDVHAR